MENDINIINLVKKGDVRAFDILVVKYQDRLVYSVFKFCKDFELSQDIAQEAFVKLTMKTYLMALYLICL